jgi:hypothetical protein
VKLRFTRFENARLESRFFAIGSVLFALGAVPGWAVLVGSNVDNLTFALGSVFFTIAAFVQLRLTGRWRPGAWRGPARADWWSAAIQFVGTILFNISTFAAVRKGLLSGQEDLRAWAPDAFGSVAFLVSSLLAFQAVRISDRLWDPRVRNWQVAVANLGVSVAFGVSALAGYFVAFDSGAPAIALMNLGTFFGGLLFLAGALLMPPADGVGSRE